MSVIGYFAPLCESALYNHLTEDTPDGLPHIFCYSVITKKTNPSPGVMGAFPSNSNQLEYYTRQGHNHVLNIGGDQLYIYICVCVCVCVCICRAL